MDSTLDVLISRPVPLLHMGHRYTSQVQGRTQTSSKTRLLNPNNWMFGLLRKLFSFPNHSHSAETFVQLKYLDQGNLANAYVRYIFQHATHKAILLTQAQRHARRPKDVRKPIHLRWHRIYLRLRRHASPINPNNSKDPSQLLAGNDGNRLGYVYVCSSWTSECGSALCFSISSWVF